MGFIIKAEELNSIRGIVDKIEFKDNSKVAFVDFNGIKNIPIRIYNDYNDYNEEKDLKINQQYVRF